MDDFKAVANDPEIAIQIASLVIPESDLNKGTVQLSIERAKIRGAIKEALKDVEKVSATTSLQLIEDLCMKKYSVVPSSNLRPSLALLKTLKEDITAYKTLKLNDSGHEGSAKELKETLDGEIHWVKSEKTTRGPKNFAELVCTVGPWALSVELLSQSGSGLAAFEYIMRLARLAVESGDFGEQVAIDYDRSYRQNLSSSVNTWSTENKMAKSNTVIKALTSNICPESMINSKIKAQVARNGTNNHTSVQKPGPTAKRAKPTKPELCRFTLDDCPFVKSKRCRFLPHEHRLPAGANSKNSTETKPDQSGLLLKAVKG
jgi:hypothetical protein